MQEYLKKVGMLKELGLLEIGRGKGHGGKVAMADKAIRGADHALSRHDSAWAYLPPRLFDADHVREDGRPLVALLDSGQSPAEVLAQTRLMVVLGAANTPTLEVLRGSAAICLVFEPDQRFFRKFLEDIDMRSLIGGRTFFFVGDFTAFEKPLFELLPPRLVAHGFPAFYVLPGVDQEYAAELIQRLEVFYFRYCLYRYEGQAGYGDQPTRRMERGMIFDQQLHLYGNVPEYLRRPSIIRLSGIFAGATALLIAAGPDLDAKIDYVLRNMDTCLVICVNSALRVLLSHGIEPHVVVMNDTSVASAETLRGLGPLPHTVLVAHCLCGLDARNFGQVFFFGTVLPSTFPRRPDLELHGSVITAAFSLALHLGCVRAVLVGAQLASPTDVVMAYSAGTLQSGLAAPLPVADPGRFPHKYPVRDALGGQMYTTLNFLDAAYWLLDHIALSGVEVVNTCPQSIIWGRGVRLDEDYRPPVPEETFDPVSALCEVGQGSPPVDPSPAREFLKGQAVFWANVGVAAATLERQGENLDLAQAGAVLARLDETNVSFLLQRFPGFCSVNCYRGLESVALETRRKALLEYFNAVACMSRLFSAGIVESLRSVEGI